MRPLRTILLLALAWPTATPALAFEVPGLFAGGPGADERRVEAFEIGLRDAIAGGDGRKVAPYFPAGGPAYAWLGARWGEMRRRELDPATWSVAFEPYYVRPDRMGGTLRLVAREARGRTVEGRFEVEAWRRGRAWVVGDALPLERPDVLIERHDLRVDLRRPGRLVVEDVLALRPTGPDRRAFFELDAGLRLRSASWEGRPVPARQHGDVLYLELPAVDQPYELTLAYEGPAPAAERAWYARPFGAPGVAVYRVMAMVPPGWAAVAPGDRIGVDRWNDGWIHHWTTPAPAPGVTLHAGELVAVEGAGATAFVRAGHEAAAAALLARAAGVAKFCAERWGAFGDARPTLVESEGPAGGGLAVLASGAFEHEATADALLAQAVARAWADGLAYRGSTGERAFMSEGLAAYVDLLHRAQRDGMPAFRERLAEAQKRYGKLVADGGDRPIAEAGDAALDAESRARVVRDKGAIVLNMLRRRIGGPAFDAGLRELWATRGGRAIGIAEFRAPFEKAGKTHLGAFFEQWLGRAGRPELTFEDVFVRALPGGKHEVVGRLDQAGRPFHLRVPLVVTLAGTAAPRLFDVEVTGARTGFKLVVPGRPRALLLDPLRDTLAAPTSDVAFDG